MEGYAAPSDVDLGCRERVGFALPAPVLSRGCQSKIAWPRRLYLAGVAPAPPLLAGRLRRHSSLRLRLPMVCRSRWSLNNEPVVPRVAGFAIANHSPLSALQRRSCFAGLARIGVESLHSPAAHAN